MNPIPLHTILEQEIIAGYHAKMIHSDSMTFAYWNISASAILPEHSHPHEQVSHMLEGEFSISLEGETVTLKAGDVFIIPPNALHSGVALTDCRILDVFSPIREDYRLAPLED